MTTPRTTTESTNSKMTKNSTATPLKSMTYKFPELQYSYSALEPYIDAKTMEVHYNKHHKTYYEKFTAAIEKTELNGQPLDKIFAKISTLPKEIRNNAGGYYNHFLYWNVMGPKAGGQPTGELKAAIDGKWGSFEKFKEEFEKAAAEQFASGWAWLIVRDGKIDITHTPNQDNPLMDVAETRGIPVLGCDVWEHAYYLKYQNKRPEYLKAFWNVVDWGHVEGSYMNSLQGQVPLYNTTV